MPGFVFIRTPDDFHLHVRQGASMPLWVEESARLFGRAVIMPNTIPPVNSAESITRYRGEIMMAAPGFAPLMTFKLHDKMASETVFSCFEAGAGIGKWYPGGATTNSEDGVSSGAAIADALGEMERLGVVLSVHGEKPEAFCLEREEAFLPEFAGVCRRYPKLKIVFEHVSSAAGVQALLGLPLAVAATFTAHHLAFTLDDMTGSALDPHFHCKPMLKTPKDRDAIREAVFSGNPRFFFGSDSAPHPRNAKECGKAAAGCFSAPVALSLLAELFAEAFDFGGARFKERLEPFVSEFGADFYGLPYNGGTVSIEERDWTVPCEIGGAVPLLAGKVMRFSVRRES